MEVFQIVILSNTRKRVVKFLNFTNSAGRVVEIWAAVCIFG